MNRAKSGVKPIHLRTVWQTELEVYAKQCISFTVDKEDKKGIQFSTSAFITTIVFFLSLSNYTTCNWWYRHLLGLVFKLECFCLIESIILIIHDNFDGQFKVNAQISAKALMKNSRDDNATYHVSQQREVFRRVDRQIIYKTTCIQVGHYFHIFLP